MESSNPISIMTSPASDTPIRPQAAAIIMAAGKSTRMKSEFPKTVHPVCGLPLSLHVVRACQAAGISRIVVVVGHQADSVKEALGTDVQYALQKVQRGTGDAVAAAREELKDWDGDILILAGDAPLLKAETITALLELRGSSGCPAVMLTAFLDDPTGYGRIIREPAVSGPIVRIVEQRDATTEEKLIKEWSPSVYVFESAALWPTLDRIEPNNSQGEFYLTDAVKILAADGGRIESVVVQDASETLGVNTRVELAQVTKIMQDRIRLAHMLAGVTMIDPQNTYIDADVSIGTDTVLLPGTYLQGCTAVGNSCVIGPNTLVKDSKIGDGTTVAFSQVVLSQIDTEVKVGPFANLRPGTSLGHGVKIGDFVELKNTTLHPNVQVNHLSYLGDCEVGANTNIGAGTITCNYDGFKKSRTEIGADAFVGSHSTLIAPVTIGEGVIVAAGSIINKSVPADALAISRAPQEVRPDAARRFRSARKARE